MNQLWNNLRKSTFNGHLALTLKLLKDAHLPLEALDANTGFSILFYSIQYHQMEIFNYFLVHECICIRDFHNNTALMISVRFNNLLAFNAIIEKFPEYIPFVNDQGKSAFILACEKGLYPMVKVFIEKGMDVNNELLMDGSTALHVASSWGYFDIVTLLMQSRANPSVLNKKGFTPVDYAFSDEMRNHIANCTESIKSNKPIVTPKRKEPDRSTAANQTTTAYVSYLRSIF